MQYILTASDKKAKIVVPPAIDYFNRGGVFYVLLFQSCIDIDRLSQSKVTRTMTGLER